MIDIIQGRLSGGSGDALLSSPYFRIVQGVCS